MTPKPLSVGLIGVGGFGANHLKVLQQLEAEGLVRLVCVADPDSERLAEIRRKLESSGVRWHLDNQSLLAKETELDAVAIAAPIHLHFEITAAAIARGLFVYLEKPPVPLIQQLRELIAMDVGKRVAVGFQLVNSSPVQQLKLWRTQGALGEIKTIRVHGCSPRSPDYYARTPWAGKMVFDGKPVFDGPATNALSHWLHNIMYLGAERINEFALPVTIQAEMYRARPIESYDTICLRGRLDSGVSFHHAVTHATETSLPCRLEMIGSKGRAWTIEGQVLAQSDLGLPATVALQPNPFLETWREFVRFARGEKPRVATHLENTQGYVLATNAALLSSSGIYQADSTAGLIDLVKQSTHDGKLFSEMGVPWAQESTLIEVASVTSLHLPRMMNSII